jgi:hypothetical protein
MFRSILIALMLVLPALAAAQDSDTQEINRYVLTDAGLAKYTQATQKLSALGAAGCEAEGGDDSDTGSLSAAVANIDANPAAKAAIQSAGMTSREFIVFGMSMLQAGLAAWGLDQPGGKLPPGVSMANVTFFRNHAAEMERLGELSKSGCDAGDTDEEDVEET